MKKLLILLLGLLALAILGYFCAYKNHAPAIQEDIHSRASAALAAEGFDWAKLKVDGRDIILTGVAPTEAEKARAAEIAKVYGYRLVDNRITVAQAAAEPAAAPEPAPEPKISAPVPYRMKAERGRDGKVLLTGYVPDAEAHAQLVKLAEEKFGADNVIDQLEEAPGAPDGWSEAVVAGLTQLQELDEGVAEWTDHRLSVSGHVASESIKTRVTNQLTSALPSGFTASTNLTAPVAAKPPPLMTEKEKVSAVSCQEQFSTLLASSIINFRTASADISPDSYVLLDKLAEVATSCPTAEIRIEGHTDSRGSAAFNQDLSQRRAQAVVDYLISKGIDASRLSAVGFGEDAPIADNNTAEGRAINRRIEFTVKGI